MPNDKQIAIPGYVVTYRGDGPYVARSASDKTEDWPFWYVHGKDRINWMMTDPPRMYSGKFLPRKSAELAAAAMNAVEAG